jgi:hypothetical protein
MVVPESAAQHLFGRRSGCGFGVNFYQMAFDANSTALFQSGRITR